MPGKQLFHVSVPAIPFFAPNNATLKPRVGIQPYAPGQSQLTSGGGHMQLIPWPRAVPALFATANHPGIPRAPALEITNNRNIVNPENYLFMSGFAAKSRG